jgi:hypothetical protein
MNLETIDKWHKTRVGNLVFGVAELSLAYLLISLAIDSGYLWEYALALVLIYGGFHNLLKIFLAHKNARKKR